MCEIFNDFFGNAVKNLNIESYKSCVLPHENIVNDDSILSIINRYEEHPNVLKIRGVFSYKNYFSFKPTDLKTVVEEIHNLNDSKASPIESIPSKILKENCNIFAPKITIDFNSCIKSGIFPENQNLLMLPPFLKNWINIINIIIAQLAYFLLCQKFPKD